MAAVYVSCFVFIVLVTAEFIYTKSVNALSPATEVRFANGLLSIPLAEVSDGDLHRYAAREGASEVRFLLYKRPDGQLIALFDACEICGAVGFFKRQNGLVCKNCASPVNASSLGTPGGCNPIPLHSSIGGDRVVIAEQDVLARVRLFER
jgi:uncharacterized membrane protein